MLYLAELAVDPTVTTEAFFGFMGVTCALVFCSKFPFKVCSPKQDLGSAYGTAKSGVGICSMGVLKPDLILKSVVPVIMAGILGVYGLIVGVILGAKSKRFPAGHEYNYY